MRVVGPAAAVYEYEGLGCGESWVFTSPVGQQMRKE